MVSSVFSAHRWDTRDLVLFACSRAHRHRSLYPHPCSVLSFYAAIIVHHPGRTAPGQPPRRRLGGRLRPLRAGRTAGLHVWRRSVLYFPADLRLSHRLHRRCLADRIHRHQSAMPSLRRLLAADFAGSSSSTPAAWSI